MASAFEGWAVVELLGHRVRYARVSEVTMFGEPFARLDIPCEPPTVEFYGGRSVYAIRPVAEEAVRRYHQPPARLDRPELEGPTDADLVDDDEQAEICGGCSKPIRFGEPIDRVADDDGTTALWHEGCAKDLADDVDSETPRGGA